MRHMRCWFIGERKRFPLGLDSAIRKWDVLNCGVFSCHVHNIPRKVVNMEGFPVFKGRPISLWNTQTVRIFVGKELWKTEALTSQPHFAATIFRPSGDQIDLKPINWSPQGISKCETASVALVWQVIILDIWPSYNIVYICSWKLWDHTSAHAINPPFLEADG